MASRDKEIMGNGYQIDLLSQIILPDRYETLLEKIGAQVAQILLPPSSDLQDSLKRLTDSIKTRREGVFIPLYGASGAGKTTFASNVGQWEASYFTPTLDFAGDIIFNDLKEAVSKHRLGLAANDGRIVPINIDHRESAPPNETELSTIKRFLRTSPAGVPCLIFWPEVTHATAKELSDRYTAIAGAPPIDLPLNVLGPDRGTWKDIAINTLAITNKINNAELLGVDPNNYSPIEFSTIGEFLRKISSDLNKTLFNLRKNLEKPLELIIVFASESSDPGVLSQLINNSRYGLLDANSLLAVSPDSVIGKWWKNNRGLLTRTIIQLNAHVLALGPAAAVSVVRNLGPSPDAFLDGLGIARTGSHRAVRDLKRTDLGKVLLSEKLDRFESRGTPVRKSGDAFKAIANRGFNLGKDKDLNKLMATAIENLLNSPDIQFNSVQYEKKLPFCPIIPDNYIDYGQAVICIEYTWRKGDFLQSGNRSTVAQYILTKLKNYARELGWTND